MNSSQVAMIQEEHTTYRPARSLPLELQEQCAIYLEEGLYNQALDLLTNLLTSGTSSSSSSYSSSGTKQLSPAYVPPPALLSFLTTLAVTPSTTTKTTSEEKQFAADNALLYLQHLRKTVDPISIRWATAYRFTSGVNFRRSVTDRRRHADEGDDDGGQAINVKMGRQQSLWSRGEDFWHVVARAFNCASNSKSRWQRWKLWLEHMLDVLEADMKERARLTLKSCANEVHTDSLLQKSLIAQYVTGISGEVGRTEQRRIMRAIFSHGTSTDEAEFKEVWKDEAAEPIKKEDPGRSRSSNGLASDDFSDEDLERDEMVDVDMINVKVEEEGSARRPRRAMKSLSPGIDTDRDMSPELGTQRIDAMEVYGGIDAVYLRRRILRLLSTLSDMDSSLFTNTDGILHLYSEALRPLPLPVFSALIMPIGQDALSASLTMSLCKEMFRSLLAAAAPRFDNNYIDQDDLEQRFLPAAANSVKVADHAKVSLLLEVSLWLLRENESLDLRPSLKTAMVTGIRARQEKAKQSRVSKSGRVDTTRDYEEGLMWLMASSKRLDIFLHILEV